jgi:L-fuconolactonase
VRDLALHDNLTCKLSGLTTMADLERWQVLDLVPFVDHLLACFGAERLLFGSDWPVSLRAGTYEQTLRAVEALVGALPPAEQAAVLGRNAQRVYAIGEVTGR